MTQERQAIRPQPGFQTAFLSTAADIAIGGGAAGAGKSYALLMEPVRHAGVPGFRAVIFRRTTVQVKNSGGLWDTSKELYLKLHDLDGRAPKPTENPPKWRFPSGASLLFSHLEQEQTKFDWDGSQIAFLGFDELIHFTPGQFWYLVGRNRSACGVKPYVRATTNPQTSGWVKNLISWWIHPDKHPVESLRGMPIPERAGVIRFLARYNEVEYWGDTLDEALAALPPDGRQQYKPELVKTVTFIPGTLGDNPALTSRDAGYEGNLLAQDARHAARLLRGCWYDALGENELFFEADLEDMFTNSFVPEGEKYMTADIAMDGSDVFRIFIWSGLRVTHLYAWQKSDGRQIVHEMELLARQHAVAGKNIAFDANGVGNFLSGFFRSAFDFRSQSAPLEERGIKVNYSNLRTQCAFWLSRLIAGSKIFMDVPSSTERLRMMEEFRAHRKAGENASGRLIITAKEEVKALIARSPDYLDCALMRMVFEIRPTKRSSLLDAPKTDTDARPGT
jgi:hypothetical protein